MSVLAVIPAKRVSTRCAGKNLRPLGGKPLVAWSIETAQQATNVSDVVVATDSQEIAGVAEFYGAQVMWRPEHLSESGVTAEDVVLWILEQDSTPALVLMAQPTSPFRTAQHIDEAMALAYECGHTVIGVKRQHGIHYDKMEHDSTVYRIYNKVSRGRYISNGAIYIAQTETLLRRRSFHADRVAPYVMDGVCNLQIDEEVDWALAEAVVERELMGVAEA